MNILLTNDDGYNSEGIILLKNKLEKYGRVVIVAPKEQMSGKSISITLNYYHAFEKKGEDVYTLDGTPADCTAFGLSMLKIKFDLVVSGCNDGWNISYDTNYSGTIGACVQAQTYHIPSIAVSCERNFEIVDKYFDMALDWILSNKLLSPDISLNVNFPEGSLAKDIKLSKLYYRDISTYYLDKPKGFFAWRELDDSKAPEGTDVYMVHNGIISVTPLGRSLFSEDIFSKIVSK